MQRVASAEFVRADDLNTYSTRRQVSPTPKSWCAPSWLFAVGVAFTGIGFLRTENLPQRDSEEKLGVAHTRLLLAGARRLFLWALDAAVERVRNEELAAARAIAAKPVSTEKGKPKARPKGFDGLGPRKANLSRYMDGLTEKQREVFSLKYKYALQSQRLHHDSELTGQPFTNTLRRLTKRFARQDQMRRIRPIVAKRGPDE